MKKNVLLWALSIFLLLGALGAFGESILSGILIMLAAVGCNPLTLNYLKKVEKYPGKKVMIPAVILLFVVGVMLAPTKDTVVSNDTAITKQEKSNEVAKKEVTTATVNSANDSTTSAVTNTQTDKTAQPVSQEKVEDKSSEAQPTSQQATTPQKTSSAVTSKQNNENTKEYNGVTYKIIEVDGGDMSGDRQSNVAVDVGYGDRVYWAYTNEYGQLINVTADKIILQDDKTEPVNSKGRYYDDEAAVPGTEQPDLDCGHIVADSLSGVSNAYNITPQQKNLNRTGDQSYMEEVIRQAGGCENFVATITYPDTSTQIPSHYHYEYDLKGNHIVDDFDNVNPDKANEKLNSQSNSTAKSSTTSKDVTNTSSNANAKSTEVAPSSNTTAAEDTTYVCNTNTMKFHYPTCSSAKRISDGNRKEVNGTRDELISQGYEPCKNCNP